MLLRDGVEPPTTATTTLPATAGATTLYAFLDLWECEQVPEQVPQQVPERVSESDFASIGPRYCRRDHQNSLPSWQETKTVSPSPDMKGGPGAKRRQREGVVWKRSAEKIHSKNVWV